jgi:hypothetical protein
MYQIITVPDDAADLTEQLGTKPKFWFQGDNSVNYLFKEGRPGTGDDWSEKVARSGFITHDPLSLGSRKPCGVDAPSRSDDDEPTRRGTDRCAVGKDRPCVA